MSGKSWEPDPSYIAESHLEHFLVRHGIDSYEDLVERCQEDVAWFWALAVGDLDLKWKTPFETLLDLSDGVEWAHWFSGGRLNAAESIAQQTRTRDDQPALICESESGISRTYSFAELEVLQMDVARRLQALGARKGDRLALYMGMNEWAVATMLACASLGICLVPLFSGYGWEPIVSRMEDCAPRFIVTQDVGYRKGQRLDPVQIVMRALDELSYQIDSLIVWCPAEGEVDLAGDAVPWPRVATTGHEVEHVATSVDDPLMLAYTSGSTGQPKGCIHVHGGLPIKIATEFSLCFDIGPNSRVLWVADAGWLLGPSLVFGVLSLGGTLVLYEGAIDYPDESKLASLVENHKLTHLGMAPTAVRTLMRNSEIDWGRFDFSTLRYLAGTGEPWDAGSWDWFREVFGEGRCPLFNYSGGTEIGGGILAGNSITPQEPCSFSGPIPGMDAVVLDVNGRPLIGGVGELAVRQPWPGMTQGFWDGPERYLATYWSRWKGIWVQGDSAVIADDGLWYVQGRSDDLINVAGRRVGPAEVEQAAMGHGSVVEAAVVGVPDGLGGTQLACFVVPTASGQSSGDGLEDEVAGMLEDHLGRAMRPRHVISVSDLPKTRNGKIMRRLIQHTFNATDPGDISALENPESLEAIERAGRTLSD